MGTWGQGREDRRSREGGRRVGGRSSEENVPHESRGPQSRDQAAAAVGVSGKLVSAAKAIKEADPPADQQQGRASR